MKDLCCLTLALAVCLAGQGCGDDSGESTAEMDSGSPGDGAIDGGGLGGTGGGDGGGGSPAGGTSGSAGSPSGPVECGDSVCETTPGGMGFMAACCLDRATSTCGTSLMGLACSRPPEPDPRCLSVSIGGVVMLSSCCTPQGECGIDASQFGAGCVELSEAEEGAMMEGGFPIDFPEPRLCDEGEGDAGAEEDAGADEDGGR